MSAALDWLDGFAAFAGAIVLGTLVIGVGGLGLLNAYLDRE